jgi:hypothetical protein
MREFIRACAFCAIAISTSPRWPAHAQVSLEKNTHINGVYFDRSGRVIRVD